MTATVSNDIKGSSDVSEASPYIEFQCVECEAHVLEVSVSQVMTISASCAVKISIARAKDGNTHFSYVFRLLRL